MCNRFLSKDQFIFFLQTLSTRSNTIYICYRFFYQYISRDQIMFFSKLYLPDIILSISVTVFFLSKDQFTFFLKTLSTRSNTIYICYRFFYQYISKDQIMFFFKLYLPDIILSICVTVFYQIHVRLALI